MSKQGVLQLHRAEILEAARQRGATSVRVFGSVARGDENEGSDVDFLVELEQGRSLFDLGGLQLDLQQILNCRVDVVTERGLHWYIRDRVLKEAMPI